MSRKFIISLWVKREGSVTKASCPDTSLSSPIPPSRLLKQPVGLAPAFLTDRVVPGPGMRGICQVWKMAWAALLASDVKPSCWTESRPSHQEWCLYLVCWSLTVRCGFPVSSLTSGVPFWIFFPLSFVTWKNWVTFKQSPLLYKLIPTISDCFPPKAAPGVRDRDCINFLIVLRGGKV